MVNRRGIVQVEFLIVIVPLLTFLLCLIQFGLLCGAKVLVAHAAQQAARAAVVVLPDDSEGADYAGDELNRVGPGEGLDAYRQAPDNGRYETIRMAARLPLSPLSPSPAAVMESSVRRALDTGFVQQLLGLEGWSRYAVALSFPDGAGGYLSAFGARVPITAEITFLFPCRVPLANNLMCHSWLAIPEDRRELLTLRGNPLSFVGIAAGWTFVALQAAHTLPNQGRR